MEDVISKGDEITARVIKLDPEHKKIALSIKEYLVDKNQINRDDIVVTPHTSKAAKASKGGSAEEGDVSPDGQP